MDFCLRKWEYSDGPALAAAADDPQVACTLRDFFPSPYTEEDALQFITYCKNTPDTLEYNRAIIAGGIAVGNISLRFGTDIYRKNAELGYWIAVPYWNRGIMTEAVRSVVQTGFHAFDLHRIYAEVFAGNDASIRVLEKNGFVREGFFREAAYKNETYLDLSVYSLLRGTI